MKIFIFVFFLALSATAKSQSEDTLNERPVLCQLPQHVVGSKRRCFAYMPMYHYDIESNLCVKFIYGGCQGTENRFEKLEDCVITCKAGNKLSDERCRDESDTGHCDAYFEKFYYDDQDKICKKFIYGGCGGNKNRFDTEQECKTTCEI